VLEKHNLSRNIAVDILKLVLALMVVGLHSHFLADVSPLSEYLTVNGLFRIAVPMFLLINGFYFYPILSNGKSLVWFKRVFSLYLFWMLFYAYFWFVPSEFSLIEAAKLVAKFIIGYHHLWYISGMLGAAAVLLVFKNRKVRFLYLLISLTFILGVTIQYLGNYHLLDNALLDKMSNYNWVHRNFLLFSFPFFCLGFLINKLEIHKKISAKQIATICLVGFFLLSFESYINYISPSRDGAFDNYSALIILCPSIFLLIMKINIRSQYKELSAYSTGIFFIHPLILTVLLGSTKIGPTGLTVIVIILSALASYILIKINKRLGFIL
jgi:hypothetical protein